MDINAKCLEILESCGQPQNVIDHCKAVAEVSHALAAALNAKGFALDPELCRRAGLLHDVRRTEPAHAEKAMDYLLGLGLEAEAAIVGAHMGEGIETDCIGEKEVVYMADKLVRGTSRVSVEERFARSLEKFRDAPIAAAAAEKKRAKALALAAYMEDILGCSLEEI